MLPSTAMPNAPPTSRTVSFTAEPTPARDAGTDDMTASVAGATIMPMPTPSRISALTMCGKYDESGANRPASSKPAATTPMPVATTGPAPTRCASLALRGAATMITPIGSVRTPASKPL